MESTKKDYVIEDVEMNAVVSNENGFGFRLSWTANVGFGDTDVFYDKAGGFRIQSESMSKDFVKAVLFALVDRAVFEWEKKNE